MWDGAFYKHIGAGGVTVTTVPSDAVRDIYWSFSAQNYNAIYGNSSAVQPASMTAIYAIKY